MSQPARGFLLTAFVVIIGILCALGLVNFGTGGAATPFIHVEAINIVITMFFLVIAFGMWPFQKLSLTALRVGLIFGDNRNSRCIYSF